jgi:NADP-dependent 3-hydroxy acid dehydrogenase YdfG
MSTRTAHLDLCGKVVAITGGARGIGLATANADSGRLLLTPSRPENESAGNERY